MKEKIRPKALSCKMIHLQAVAVGDVRRELTFCRKTGIPVIGIIENMSGYKCPHCSVSTTIDPKYRDSSTIIALSKKYILTHIRSF